MGRHPGRGILGGVQGDGLTHSRKRTAKAREIMRSLHLPGAGVCASGPNPDLGDEIHSNEGLRVKLHPDPKHPAA